MGNFTLGSHQVKLHILRLSVTETEILHHVSGRIFPGEFTFFIPICTSRAGVDVTAYNTTDYICSGRKEQTSLYPK